MIQKLNWSRRYILSLTRSADKWGGSLSRMTHELREQRIRSTNGNISTHDLAGLSKITKNIYTFTNNRHRNFEKPPWLPRISYAHVIPRDFITNKLSYVACNTQHLMCCVQHSTFPVLNAINMFALCNPCNCWLIFNYFN